MSGVLHIPLDPREEIALRRVALGAVQDDLAKMQLRRLEELRLIERRGGSWQLTPLGQLRHESLAKPLLQRQDDTPNEIDRILDKHRA